MKSNEDIIKEEFELIVKDIIDLYNSSGKRTSGKFQEDLKIKTETNKGILFGNRTLAGRSAGKMPPVESIKQWIEKKGIKPLKDNITSTGLAWAIAKSIAKKGTKESNHLKIYEMVITPERVDSVIKKVSEFNVNLFVQQVETQLELLEKNI